MANLRGIDNNIRQHLGLVRKMHRRDTYTTTHEFCRKLLEIRAYLVHLVHQYSRGQIHSYDEPGIECGECGEWPAKGEKAVLAAKGDEAAGVTAVAA